MSQTFPSPSQVTCYSYKDVNNWWIIKKPDIEELVVTEPTVTILHT